MRVTPETDSSVSVAYWHAPKLRKYLTTRESCAILFAVDSVVLAGALTDLSQVKAHFAACQVFPLSPRPSLKDAFQPSA